jgi:pyruvate formate-lyase activating enzyme-like uncharacterized protein
MISHSPIGQRARDLCTCGHQYAAHQKGISNTTCALCYCYQFKKDTNRIFKGDLSPVKGRKPLTEPPRRPLS